MLSIEAMADHLSSRPRTFVVTGASSGIGRELARRLAGQGHRVIAVGRDADRLAETARLAPGIEAQPFDLAKVGAIDAFVADLVRRRPDIDGLVNNAAFQENVRMDEPGYGAGRIAREIDVNLAAPIALCRALLGHLAGQPSAVIVNVTSGLAFAPKRTSAVYCATKAGLHLFSEALRAQLSRSDVAVVEAVLPLVDTPMTAGRGRGKISAAAAAEAVVAGLKAGHARIFVGKARALPLLLRWAPSVARRIMLAS